MPRAKKSKSKSYWFRGKCAWAMLYSPDEYLGREFYKINFYPSDEVLEEMEEVGLFDGRRKIKEDDGGNSGVSGKFVQFTCDTEKELKDGKVWYFHPPKVLDRDENIIVDYKWVDKDKTEWEREGEPVLIGNGSEVEVLVEVYDAGRFGKGSRLKAVQIIDLIEYKPDDEDEEVESKPEPKKETKKEEAKGTTKKKSVKVDW